MYRCVSGTDLLVCGKNIYNHYEDCKDANYYLCSDQINDVVCLSRERWVECWHLRICKMHLVYWSVGVGVGVDVGVGVGVDVGVGVGVFILV